VHLCIYDRTVQVLRTYQLTYLGAGDFYLPSCECLEAVFPIWGFGLQRNTNTFSFYIWTYQISQMTTILLCSDLFAYPSKCKGPLHTSTYDLLWYLPVPVPTYLISHFKVNQKHYLGSVEILVGVYAGQRSAHDHPGVAKGSALGSILNIEFYDTYLRSQRWRYHSIDKRPDSNCYLHKRSFFNFLTLRIINLIVDTVEDFIVPSMVEDGHHPQVFEPTVTLPTDSHLNFSDSLKKHKIKMI